jgi:hypothetical protein
MEFFLRHRYHGVNPFARLSAVYNSDYVYNSTTLSCLEDPGTSLANEILAHRSPPTANTARAGGPAPSGSGSGAAKVGAAIGASLAGALVAAGAGLVLLRRRRRQRRLTKAEQAQRAQRDAKLESMESGELADLKPAGSLGSKASGDLIPLEDPTDPLQAPNCSAAVKNTLWRSK